MWACAPEFLDPVSNTNTHAARTHARARTRTKTGWDRSPGTRTPWENQLMRCYEL